MKNIVTVLLMAAMLMPSGFMWAQQATIEKNSTLGISARSCQERFTTLIEGLRIGAQSGNAQAKALLKNLKDKSGVAFSQAKNHKKSSIAVATALAALLIVLDQKVLSRNEATSYFRKGTMFLGDLRFGDSSRSSRFMQGMPDGYFGGEEVKPSSPPAPQESAVADEKNDPLMKELAKTLAQRRNL